MALYGTACLAAEPNKEALKAVNSMMNEAGAKTFISMIDDNVLRNGKPGKHKERMAKELAGFPEGVSQILELEEVRVIDFAKLNEAFKGLNQARLERVKKALAGKYNSEDHYGIVVISKYRKAKPHKAVNAMIFRVTDWKIIEMDDD
jgi:hypothetical protein